jgi:hypothetical protein
LLAVLACKQSRFVFGVHPANVNESFWNFVCMLVWGRALPRMQIWSMEHPRWQQATILNNKIWRVLGHPEQTKNVGCFGWNFAIHNELGIPQTFTASFENLVCR